MSARAPHAARGRRPRFAPVLTVVALLGACSDAGEADYPSVPGSTAPSGTSSSGGAAPTTAMASTPSGPPTPAPSPSRPVSPSSDIAPISAMAGLSAEQTRCVAAAMRTMTTTERAGQVLMVGVPVAAASSAAAVIKGYQVGGVFLRGRSAISVTALRRQVDAVQRASRQAVGIPVHVAVDQEGGLVQTPKGPGFPIMPTARVQGGWSTSRLRATTTASAKALRRGGITMNLAPVADTVSLADVPRNPPIGKLARGYGHTPTAVAVDVATVIAASQAAGVSTAAKHFPGLGRVRANTDHSTSATDPVATSSDPDLLPFRAAVKAHSRAIMISSAYYPKLLPRHIAAFSPRIVTDLLRTELGYTGVAISDDLGQAKAVAAVPVGRRAVDFVAAGGDLVLTVRAGQVVAMRRALLVAAARSPVFARRLAAAATRLVASKVESGLIPC